jgi:DNA ligase (NAD+)
MLTRWSGCAVGLPVERHWARRHQRARRVLRQVGGRRRTLDFDTDGVVIKVDQMDERRLLGTTSKFPRWAIAFKFPRSRRPRFCRRLKVNVGRTRAVTPFAMLDPIFIAGSTVSIATLHNADDIARKDIRERDWVLVEKAGDVIPRVVGPVLSRRPHDAVPAGCRRTVPDAARRFTAPKARWSGAARTPRAPRSCNGSRAFRVALRHEYRRPRRVAHRPAHRARMIADYADVYALTADALGPDEHLDAGRRSPDPAARRREKRREGRGAGGSKPTTSCGA